jgi:hypothetical protein
MPYRGLYSACPDTIISLQPWYKQRVKGVRSYFRFTRKIQHSAWTVSRSFQQEFVVRQTSSAGQRSCYASGIFGRNFFCISQKLKGFWLRCATLRITGLMDFGQWLGLTPSKGPNRVGVSLSLLSREYGNRTSFRKVVFSFFLESLIIGKVHKPGDSVFLICFI